MNPQRNIALVLGLTLAASASILLLNLSIDPLALNSAGKEERSAADRARLAEPFWFKAFAVSNVRPRGLILGTSRAEAGLDAGHAAFPAAAQPAYNLALAGSNVAQIRDLLIHAQSVQPLRVVVIGLDMEAFLPGGRTDFDPAILAGNRESVPAWLNRLRLDLSWRALGAGVQQLRPASSAVSPYVVYAGARGLFQIAEFDNFHSRLPQLFPQWTPRSDWNDDARRAASMRAFRDLVAYARASGIDLRLFISPVHARYLELYRRVGWWPLFESWKRALVSVLANEARAGPVAAAFPLWDFSGFNAMTMETVSPIDDLKTQMQWFTDPSHYSRQFGMLIMELVLGVARTSRDGPASPGVRLQADDIDAHLGRLRRDADAYRTAFPAEVVELGRTVDYLRARVRK